MKTKPIDYFSLSHPMRGVASLIALKARKKIFKTFMETMKPTRQTRILDVGVTPDTTLPDSNFFEKLYPHKATLVSTSIEDISCLKKEYSGITFIQTEKKSLPFCDNAFDIVFCSAVLEHVGERPAQINFLKELLRVSKRFFITTPNRQFPVEFHTFLPFIHWLPQPLHQNILERLGMPFWAKTKNLNLLSPQTIPPMFPPCTEVNIKKIYLLAMPSNLMIYGVSAP